MKLEEYTEAYRADPTKEKADLMVNELKRMIAEDEELIADLIPSPVNPTIRVPSGYYGPDQKFYIHLFTSMARTEESDVANPKETHLKSLCLFMEKNDSIGGFSLNSSRNEGAVLITRDDLA